MVEYQVLPHLGLVVTRVGEQITLNEVDRTLELLDQQDHVDFPHVGIIDISGTFDFEMTASALDQIIGKLRQGKLTESRRATIFVVSTGIAQGMAQRFKTLLEARNEKCLLVHGMFEALDQAERVMASA